MDSTKNCPECLGDCNSVLEGIKEELKVKKFYLKIPNLPGRFTEDIWIAKEIHFDWIGRDSDVDIYEFESQYARDRALQFFKEAAIVCYEREYDPS